MNIPKKIFLVFLRIVYTGVIILLLLLKCREIPPMPEYIPTVSISTESIGITRIVLRLHFTETKPPRSFSLFKNGVHFITDTLVAQDTLLLDTTLFRGRTYTYKAYRLRGNTRYDSSKTLTITTLDSATIALTADDVGVTDALLKVCASRFGKYEETCGNEIIKILLLIKLCQKKNYSHSE
ncbi:MAG: hypothetical protein FJ218_01235 [Ignavibacteria bacterium]|nr:hypothetical protein [Ignavibacteria bacterium]